MTGETAARTGQGGAKTLPWQAIGGWIDRAVPMKSEALSLAAGLRAATACALPVLVAEASGHHELSWIAIVAFWGSLADSGGAWRTRFVAMAGFTGLATMGCALAMLAAGSIWLAVPFVFAWSFGASLARIYGNSATVVGSLLVAEVIVCLGTPPASAIEAIERVGMTLVGGCWATVLVLVIWRLSPYGPARRGVAACWSAVASYADALGHLHRGGAADPAKAEADWAHVIRSRRAAAREAIEAGRALLAGERRRRAGESRRGALLLVLLVDVDQVFEALTALSEMLETKQGAGDRSSQRALRLMLHRIAQTATGLAADLAGGRTPPPCGLARSLARVKTRLARMPGGMDSAFDHAASLLERIVQYFDVAIDTAAGIQPPSARPQIEPIPAAVPRPGIWAPLRANLTPSSLNARHALRLAIAVAMALWLADYFALARGYWIGITAAVILQPFLATTWQRAVERVVGSVLGGLIAAVIGLILPDPMAIVALLFPLAVATMAVRSVNYTLFVLLLTPQFVLIAELFQTGLAPSWQLAGLRALDSVLGGALGLAAGFLLWPSREATQLPKQLAQALRANRDYLAAALAGVPDAAVQAARRRAGLASNNAEASFQRLLSEPRRRPPKAAEPAMTILGCLRRLAGAAATLSLVPAETRTAAVPVLATMRDWSSASIDAIAKAIEQGADTPSPQALPDLPAEGVIKDEIARIQRQIDVIHGAAKRLVGGAAGRLGNEEE